MGKKISQYTPITTLANGDLLDVSQDTGSGTFGTKSISYANLLTQLTTAISSNATLYGLYAQTVVSATVTNTTTETSIVGSGVGSLSVPADTFLRGDSYHAKIGGVISAQNGDDITINIKTGATVLATTGAISLSPVTALGWELELDFTIASLTATGSMCTNGNFAYNRDTGSLEGFVFQDVQTIDTTIANTLDITVTWGQAKTQDQIYSANFVLYKTY
jgi:2-methylaconitate cis-trans-isomerase PrpF